MLLQVDAHTLGLNLWLIIGALLFIGTAFIAFIAGWMCVNSLIWLARQHRAERTYRKRTFRADGERYPGFMEGMCTECHRGDRKIYFPSGTDKELCPPCYERYWRREKVGIAADCAA